MEKRNVTIFDFTKVIIRYNVATLLLVIVFYFLSGFDFEELSTLLAVLTPVTALYFGISKHYMSEVDEHDAVISTRQSFVLWLIRGHIGLLCLLISLKALLPNVLNFKELILLIGLIESVFGYLMGDLLKQLFKPQ